jgi:hypothetical protein
MKKMTSSGVFGRPGDAKHLIACVAGWSVAIVLCVWIYEQLKHFAWTDFLKGIPTYWWPIAATGWMAAYGLRAWRLKQEWEHVGLVPWARCLSIVLRHNAAVLLLPMRLGEAGYLLEVRRQWGVDLTKAGWSLLRLRSQDALVLASMAVASLVPMGPWLVGGSLLLVMALKLALPSSPIGPRSGYWARVSLSIRRWLDSPGWAVATLYWCLRLAVLGGFFVLLAVSPASHAIGVAVGAELGALWPLQGPAGVGPFEGGAWAAAYWLGSVPEGLLAAALTAHLFCIATALIAAACTLPWFRSWASRPDAGTEMSAK